MNLKCKVLRVHRWVPSVKAGEKIKYCNRCGLAKEVKRAWRMVADEDRIAIIEALSFEGNSTRTVWERRYKRGIAEVTRMMILTMSDSQFLQMLAHQIRRIKD